MLGKERARVTQARQWEPFFGDSSAKGPVGARSVLLGWVRPGGAKPESGK